jgi:D-glycero-D-manno-heptose 1,7-bisphosphate phosphatase
MNKAVFLDRDGTIIQDRHYLKNVDEIMFEDRAVPALHMLLAAGYKLIIVTNQSGIGRGLITEDEYTSVSRALDARLFANEVTISATYYCPNHPQEGVGEFKVDCGFRKPGPGMILQGIEQFNLDPAKCIMVGDKLIDVAAGQAAGLKKNILVRTGKGVSESKLVGTITPDAVAEDLYDAVVNEILN